ncbi:MAG: MgtC/SapB family protein [Chloroflexota bacterium]
MSVELEAVLRLVLAALLGGIIGFQREREKKPAGLRTHILICLGAAVFTVASMYGFGLADPARVAAGIVTGIGFLGAGAIIQRHEGGVVVGLTTAATIWIVAGIGVTAGAGLYWIAVVTTVIALIVLYLPHRIQG